MSLEVFPPFQVQEQTRHVSRAISVAAISLPFVPPAILPVGLWRSGFDSGAGGQPSPRKIGFIYPWWASSSAQPGWPQLQASSVVSLASLQYGLQYLLSPGAMQLQAG